jgi:hypothetical protein
MVGDKLIVASRRLQPVGLEVSYFEQDVGLKDDLAKVSIKMGDHLLTVSNEDTSTSYPLHGVKRKQETPERMCWIDLIASEMTVQALVGGQLALRIDSYIPLEGLELTVELETAERLFDISTTLGQLPEIITKDSDLWSILLDENSRQVIIQEAAPVLRARVGALAFASWQLEQRVTSCWWEGTGAEISLQSEFGNLPFGCVTDNRPFDSPGCNLTLSGSGAILYAPNEIDQLIHDPSAEFRTLCVAPSAINLRTPEVQKPRLRRRRRASHGSIGLEDLIEAYLRWALAETSTPTAELRRRQVTALLDSWSSELCCGEVWANREAELGFKSTDPWQLLIKTCDETGLGCDPNVELPPGDEANITRLAVAEIRRIRPELWALVGPPYEMYADDHEAFDLACGRAYTQLAKKYRDQGQENLAVLIEDGDPGTADEDWVKSLTEIKAKAELHKLAEMLIPSDSVMEILTLDFTTMSSSDITEEFIRWSRKANRSLSGGIPNDAILEAILMLWLAPEKAVILNWRGALDTLIAERTLARMGRYMCLRSRDLSGGGGI